MSNAYPRSENVSGIHRLPLPAHGALSCSLGQKLLPFHDQQRSFLWKQIVEDRFQQRVLRVKIAAQIKRGEEAHRDYAVRGTLLYYRTCGLFI